MVGPQNYHPASSKLSSLRSSAPALHESDRSAHRHASRPSHYKSPHSPAQITPISSPRLHSPSSHPTQVAFQFIAAHRIRTMASRSVSAMLALGFLVVAAFYMSEASATNAKGHGLVNLADVKISVLNNCGNDVRIVVGFGKVLDCKKGKLAVLGPLKVKLVALNLLKLELFVFDKHGKLLKVKAVVNVNLSLLGKLINGITELLFEVVEEIVEGVKEIKLLNGKVVVAKVVLKL